MKKKIRRKACEGQRAEGAGQAVLDYTADLKPLRGVRNKGGML